MSLRRYLTAPPAEPARAAPERCELCAVPIPAEHDHLVDVTGRSLPCACQACYLLFVPGPDMAPGRRFAAVPREYVALPGFPLSATDWAALDVPVRLVFVFVNSVLGHPVALYPSPAGAAESQLPPQVWAQLLARHPYTAALPADVMALLVQAGPDGPSCHAVPIDACYRLVGLVRTHWRGFDGGEQAHAAIDGFLAEVRSRAVPAPEPLAAGVTGG
ncbi:hypothetical protein CS0771_67090 [Catellatospora sp. IY07-71]|uniref:DUF5947 family protein n=1 Tax=Catellatospora sp. IY07-71 TaxID=2728827 RepID=UPI001BB39E92|nr:DUF5947 family protein [Catellatospora sp. IY07-71]BCJ77165.1 hypothetical protein CS0771_67090 [Catellatospora sp. IY07-71]